MTAEAQSRKRCAFVRSDGTACTGLVEAEQGELCFWHDPGASKEGEDIKARLEEWASSGESMEGFVLRYARLEGVRLMSAEGRDLRRANLFRARLQGASMWNVDLRETELLKADLSGANLNEAKMQGVVLLGANLAGARLERVEWGVEAREESQARDAHNSGRHEEALKKYLEAEEVYRVLRQSYDGAGRSEEAGLFFAREMTMRRMGLPKWSGARVWSKTVDLFCAYGESPPRVIGASILLNLLCAVIYFIVGVKGPGGEVVLDAQADVATNAMAFFNCVYYSIVTFTTLGYGDITPIGIARPLAAVQAFTGAFMMAMFVAVFGKKMTR